MSSIAAHFEALRHRFPPESGRQITDAQQSFETMQAIAATDRPMLSRCAYFEIGGIKYLIWEMDDEMDRFQVFATFYNIPLGILRLSSKPSGVIIVAGFEIDLGVLASFIGERFGEARRPDPARIQDGGKKRNLMLFGMCESFGHHAWNEVSGLTSVMESGLFDGLDGFILGPFDYFNIGPLLNAMGKPVWKLNSMGTLLPDQLMIYHNNVVTAEARRLIIDNATAQAQAQAASPAPGNYSICFQIRRHRRRWINEEEKLEAIIRDVARERPDTVFYIDGHSSSKGIVPVWKDEIANEEACFSRLSARLGDIDLRSTIGTDINEKINVLKNADLFVGPIGSGGVLSSWILRKPTIAYGPTSLYNMMWHQERIAPEGGSMVSAVDPGSIQDNRDGDSSFDVDADAILDLIRQDMQKRQEPQPDEFLRRSSF
jgi:hypothetical protein